MAEDLSIVIKPRDYFDVIRLQEPRVLEEFLEQPLSYIAETLTGALAVGKTGSMVAGGRIVQALLKGKLFQQFGTEFKKLREAGRIPDDFAEHRYGFQTWVELMTIIDEDSPDADRLDALKAMFYAVNKINATDGERIEAYQLWQIAKGLSSGEILLLKAAVEWRTENPHGRFDYAKWVSAMAASLGHKVKGLITLNDRKLTEMGLFIERPQQAAPVAGSARLTDLGVKVIENIKTYQLVLQEIGSNPVQE